MEKDKTKKKSTAKKTEKNSNKPKMTFNLNRDTLGVLITIVVVVAVAAFSFFLAFSLRRDVGASIPNNFSRYIGSDFVVGFPGGWQISSGGLSGFSAAQVNAETGESEGSITVTALSMQDIVTDGSFTGYNDEGCEAIRAYLSEQQNIVTGEDFVESEAKSVDINGSDACQIDTVEENTLGEDTDQIHTRYIIVEKSGIDESFIVVGYWFDGEEIEDDIITSLRTFEVLESEDNDEDEDATEDSSEEESSDETEEEATDTSDEEAAEDTE